MDRPVFLVAAPCAGVHSLYATLAAAPDLFTPGADGTAIVDGLDELHPSRRGWASDRLVAEDATPRVASVLETRWLAVLRGRDGNRTLPPRPRLLDGPAKGCLRVPFLRTVFPDARFVLLRGDARAMVRGMLDVWRSGRAVSHPELPGWAVEDGPTAAPWSLPLVPGWRQLCGRPLEEVVAHQWSTATTILLDDLEALPADAWCVVDRDRLVAEPQQEVERLCAFLGLEWDRPLTAPLRPPGVPFAPEPASASRRDADLVDRIAAQVAPVAERADDLLARRPSRRMRIVPSSPSVPPEAAEDAAGAPNHGFGSVHTDSFTRVLKETGVSLLVSTYQSGRVVVVRRDGPVTNTHFVALERPMGLAVVGDRLAVGTRAAIWDYRRVDALTARLEPPGRHDACFLPRNAHVTGDLAVHEIAFDRDGTLWMVNTRFSALCTVSPRHSFVPRWRPPFVSALVPEDRCHLNGLGMVDGRARLVTALGETDTAGGWREGTAGGGALIDVYSGKTLVRGLSMPHSPRWHDGRIWVLESGNGALRWVDTEAGKVETVALLPGFTRGLAFAGRYAFVGLSQVRESVFDGIPLSRRLDLTDRACGVWVVDLRGGEVVAFLRFEDAVQEIFDVQVLPATTFPEILDVRSELVLTHFEVPPGSGA